MAITSANLRILSSTVEFTQKLSSLLSQRGELGKHDRSVISSKFVKSSDLQRDTKWFPILISWVSFPSTQINDWYGHDVGHLSACRNRNCVKLLPQIANSRYAVTIKVQRIQVKITEATFMRTASHNATYRAIPQRANPLLPLHQSSLRIA